ncbi:e3 ubiquitin-protein ligase ZNF598 [Caerostris darwini]|uniref:RING-type E3 ubiquitin transferase n=1 Tax=Caerostris darwini TaxID=1538125 RepID=A0AAV4X314_9ARAC|nr:e3 ubiquitin-protein ligase ZNF598 [Caerostris darwini]
MKSVDQEECILCCREIELYATGPCDHPVCYVCATRMRVLCETNDCPVCRSDMPVVVFTRKLHKFSDISKKFKLCIRKYQIMFEDVEVSEAFDRLLENKCKHCDSILPTFDKLKEHVRRIHELHYCELCTENLKIFTFERKCYSRKDLAQHKRHGDPDEKSHRGHPLCEFCDQRYVDGDELFRHLRKDHFFCHFCDADGMYHYYKDYEYLRNHFRKEHYLCEEGSCINETFTSAFRTEIDLKAHIAVHHSRNKSKAEAKQARVLDFEFAYPSMGRLTGSASPRGGRYAQNRRRNAEENSQSKTRATQQELENLDTHSVQEFPYLSEDGVNKAGNTDSLDSMVNSLAYSRNQPLQYRKNVMSNEDFPALSSTETSAPSFSESSYIRNPPTQQKKNIVPVEDFPALSSSTIIRSSTSENSNNQTSNTNSRPVNSSILMSNMINHSVQRNVPVQNTNVGSTESRSRKTESEGGDRPQQKSKWNQKKNDFNFEEEFPTLEVKNKPLPFATASVPKMSNFATNSNSKQWPPDPKVNSSANNNSKNKPPDSTKAASSSVEPSPNDHFVVIKKSKKKKQGKIYSPPDITSEESSKPLISSKINVIEKENNDSLKKYIVQPAARSRNTTAIDTWSGEKVTFGNEDFPPLAPAESVKKPPGFKEPVNRAPPPGFTATPSVSNSLKGINTLKDAVRDLVLSNQANGVKNSSSEVTFAEYKNPPNFQFRNDKLIATIYSCVNADAILFQEFKSVSGRFRCNEISAAEYHAKCLEIFREKGVMDIFPELVSLLPDIKKQQELLTVHNMFRSQLSRGATSKKLTSNNCTSLVSCEKCNQVLDISDCNSHYLLHNRE